MRASRTALNLLKFPIISEVLLCFSRVLHFINMELFKTIIGFEKYEISNLGNVRSLYKRRFNIENLKLLKDKKGYLHVNLYHLKKLSRFSVHRLVAIAFIDNPENKTQVNHINGIKDDNRDENLEWCTSKENIKHAFNIGLKKMTKGTDCSWSKLTEENVSEIRKSKLTQKQLSIIYNISQTQISRIKNNLRWSV